MADTELCGKWMPLAKASCARSKGHGYECKQAKSLQAHRDSERLKYASDPDLRKQKRLTIDRRAAEIKDLIDSIKLDSGCIDCGYAKHACALDFDHLPGFEKVGGIARLRRRKLEIIAAELEKCEVVCANCHRVRTERRSRG